MENKNKLFTTRVYRHLLSVYVHAENEDKARETAREKFFEKGAKMVGGLFRIEVKEISPGFFLCEVFNFYYIETLHLREYLFHLFCKIKATISSYVGIAPEIIVIA